MRNSFGAFILSHGRPDRVLTYTTLRKRGYTGPIYIVCDDEDETIEEYRARFENVLVFSKQEIGHTVDTMDGSKERRGVTYARNVCFDLAKQLGWDYFVELDDDYNYFMYRLSFDNLSMRWDKQRDVRDMDTLFDSFIDFLESSPRILSVAFGQGG